MSNNKKVQPAIKGRLEVLYKDQWGTVCSDHFDNRDARVACRNMGLTGGKALGNWDEPGEGRIWLDDMFCKGTEKKLEECSRSYWRRHWGSHNCTHRKDVGIKCG